MVKWLWVWEIKRRELRPQIKSVIQCMKIQFEIIIITFFYKRPLTKLYYDLFIIVNVIIIRRNTKFIREII